ncbi:AraC family transcriptional regulator ligand-binding domain-containing protein [Thalassolituus sp. LLYu03]|uniref:AraC family transcriptional regulator n=1 Tax=Thalassolituus sp. LLYu03 TaxID=3421656 RepID=UPI003D2AA3A2
MFLVRSGAAAQFEPLVRELGHNPVAMMRRAGLYQAQFRDPNTYIAYDRLAHLLEDAAATCGQPLFGLMLAQRQSLSALGDLPMLVARAATVAEALERVNQYLYLHASGVTVQVEPQGEQVRLALSLQLPSGMGLNQILQMSVAQLARFIAGLLNVSVSQIALHLRQSWTSPGTPEQYPGAGAPLKFQQAFDGVLIRAQQLHSRNHQDEDALNAHLQAHLQYLQSRYPGNLGDQAKDVIGRLLPTGECSTARVAAALGMHERTLQTRLQQQHTSYRQLLQEVRQSVAEQQLLYGQQSITELALQLGYAEVAVFSRHFRQWTGHSPRQWQQEAHRSLQANSGQKP